MAMERENRAPRGAGRKRKKVCQFCVDKCEYIDYKDAAKLRRFISERSKTCPARTTGTCAMHQRQLTEAIKRPSDRSAALRHRVSFLLRKGLASYRKELPLRLPQREFFAHRGGAESQPMHLDL